MIDMRTVMEEVIMTPDLNMRFTLSGLPAPRFCPVSVATAMLMDIAGIKANISTLKTAQKHSLPLPRRNSQKSTQTYH